MYWCQYLLLLFPGCWGPFCCPSAVEFSWWCSRGTLSATCSSTVTPLTWKCGLQERETSFHSKALNQLLHILISLTGLFPGFFPESRNPELYLCSSSLSWASHCSVKLILHVEVSSWWTVPWHEVLINICTLVSFFHPLFFNAIVCVCKAPFQSTPGAGSFIQLSKGYLLLK